MHIKSSKDIVALDIGTSSIKAISAHHTKDKDIIIKKYSIFELKSQNSLNTELIKTIFQEMNLQNGGVNISISGPSTILRYITLPPVKPNELKGILKFELEKHIPFNIDEVLIDGLVIKEIDKAKFLVIAAAVKKDFINSRIKLLKDAGVSINLIDLDPIAIINAYNFQFVDTAKNKTLALINIGASFTNLSIVRDSIPCFNRDLSIGGFNLTKRISDSMGVSLAEAESLKINPGKRSDEINQICEPAIEDLVSEIKFSFDYFENKENVSIDKMFLSGGGCKLQRLGHFLKEILNVPYENWDPLSRFKFDEKLEKTGSGDNNFQFAVAAGLILRQ